MAKWDVVTQEALELRASFLSDLDRALVSRVDFQDSRTIRREKGVLADRAQAAVSLGEKELARRGQVRRGH